jgi:hypothetical protein
MITRTECPCHQSGSMPELRLVGLRAQDFATDTLFGDVPWSCKLCFLPRNSKQSFAEKVRSKTDEVGNKGNQRRSRNEVCMRTLANRGSGVIPRSPAATEGPLAAISVTQTSIKVCSAEHAGGIALALEQGVRSLGALRHLGMARRYPCCGHKENNHR